jgi:CheY-like chemotaxis protein
MDRRATVNILLVEDDQVERKAFVRALQKLHLSNPLTVARDGIEAWEILKGLNGRAPLPQPNLLVVDINLPRLNGLELVQRIRADDSLRDSVVFMLTTSDNERDRIEAFNLEVAGYMLKADIDSNFVNAVDMLKRYWTVVEMPRASGRQQIVAADRRQYVRHPDSRGVL